MGLIKQQTQESYTQGIDVPTISPLSSEEMGRIRASFPEDYYIRNGYGKPMSKYEIRLDKRISLAGILQAVIGSQGLLLEPGGTWEERVEKATLRFVKFVEENSR